MKKRSLSEIALWLQERDDFTILTHRRPDGDTIGCAAALCRGLRQLGKTASVLENPQFTEKYRPYLQGLTAQQLSGHMISVDVAAETMFLLGYEGQPIELLIDHHGSNTGFAAEGYVDASAAACGEIILELLQLLGVSPDAKIAEAEAERSALEEKIAEMDNLKSQMETLEHQIGEIKKWLKLNCISVRKMQKLKSLKLSVRLKP